MYKLFAIIVLLSAAGFAQTAPVFNWNSRLEADPLITGSERMNLFVHNNFLSPGAYFQSVAPAIAEELGNQPKEWGRTSGGFGRRVGMNALKYTSQGVIRASFDALLGYDPRYQRCDCKGSFRRVGHALTGLVLSADSSGTRRFDPTKLVAAYSSGYIAASLYPSSYSMAVKGGQIGHSLAGEALAENLFLEFGPDVKRFFRTKILRRP